ncbi:MAG: cation:proton antiporter [Candidatus Saccharimonadales bacterium]
MDSSSIFTQLSLIIVFGGAVSIVMKLLRQPLIIGYILTGILVGPSMFNLIEDKSAFETYSQIGITLLLFIIGLGLNIGVIKSLGRISLSTAGMLLVSIGGLGLLAGILLGFTPTEAMIIGLALFFSSTIIILKVLSDKRELTRLHGQIALGVILVDDIVATFALLFVAAAGTAGTLGISDIVSLILRGLGLGLGLYIFSTKLMPHFIKFFASSQELLFMFTISWGFGVATLFDLAGFSHEVGALFAGVSLASLPYATEMAARLKPLRDFFIVLFFVVLGESLGFGAIQEGIIPAIILSLIVIIGKPLFVMASLGLHGYTKLTSFKAAINLSQISEFSIILVVYAASVGLVDPSLTAIITLVALITISTSTYLMKYDDAIYNLLEPRLQVFERKFIKEHDRKRVSYPIILFGYHRGGHEFLQAFREMKQRYLVVDYDPEVIEHLDRQGVRNVYGDATDEELLHEISASKAKLVVSTVSDMGVNRSLLGYMRYHNPSAVFICHADSYEQAEDLYKHGATYVMLPHFLGSERIGGFIKKHGFNHKAFETYRKKHVISLGKRAMRN